MLYLGGVQEEGHVQHPAPLLGQFDAYVLVPVSLHSFDSVPLLTMEAVLNRLPQQSPTLLHHGIQALVLHVHRVLRVRRGIRHVLARRYLRRIENLQGLIGVQCLGEQENELKHTRNCFWGMSSLAQAQESVHREQHAVQLQNFRIVADQGEGISRELVACTPHVLVQSAWKGCWDASRPLQCHVHSLGDP